MLFRGEIHLGSPFFGRITPTLFASCRANLMKFCALPTAWSMSSNLSDTFVGKHLGCLYQNRLKVSERETR